MTQTLDALFWTLGLWVILAVAWPRRQPRFTERRKNPRGNGLNSAKASMKHFDAEMDLI